MTVSVMFSSVMGGMLGLALAQVAGLGLADSVMSYSGGGMLATAVLVVYHMGRMTRADSAEI